MEIAEKEYENLKERADSNSAAVRVVKFAVMIGVILLCLLVCLVMWGCPTYNVWAKSMDGQAALSEAEYSKQVQIQEAQSNLDAEKLNAQAEEERAKGAAKARNAEGLGMTSEEYIQYLWVKKLSLADASIIYLPTEGGIPTLTQDVLDPPSVENTDNPDMAAEQQ